MSNSSLAGVQSGAKLGNAFDSATNARQAISSRLPTAAANDPMVKTVDTTGLSKEQPAEWKPQTKLDREFDEVRKEYKKALKTADTEAEKKALQKDFGKEVKQYQKLKQKELDKPPIGIEHVALAPITMGLSLAFGALDHFAESYKVIDAKEKGIEGFGELTF